MDKRLRSSKASKRKILTIGAGGILLLLIALLLIIIDPLELIVNHRTRIANGSEILGLLKEKDSPGIHLSAYLFNVTNAQEFMAGKDEKLRVEEVGPFTYWERRTNVDLELDEEAELVRYTPRTKAVFLPEESIANPWEVNVTMPNVAMLSMASMMASYPYLSQLGFNLLLSHLQSRAIVNQTAHEFLWGYDEPLIKLGNTVLPGWITFDTLGLLDRLYDRTVEYRLEVSTSSAERFSVKSMNGFQGLNAWEYEEPSKRSTCNSFTDSYEGIGYPNRLTAGAPLKIFRNVLCRFLPLDYQGITTMEDGVQGLYYKISNETFNINNDTDCLCSKGICIKGVSDLSPCFYKLPLALSNAHFLHGDPSLFDRVEGLEPDEKKHGSEIIIEPRLGMVIKTAFSVQVNVVVRSVNFNTEAGRFSDMVVPLLYLKMVQPELTDQNKYDLKLMYVIVPHSLWAVEAVLFIAGFILLAYSVQLFLSNWIYSRAIVFQAPESGKAPVMPSAMPLLL